MAKKKEARTFTVANPRGIPEGIRIFVCELACAECGHLEADHPDPTHEYAAICGAEFFADWSRRKCFFCLFLSRLNCFFVEFFCFKRTCDKKNRFLRSHFNETAAD